MTWDQMIDMPDINWDRFIDIATVVIAALAAYAAIKASRYARQQGREAHEANQIGERAVEESRTANETSRAALEEARTANELQRAGQLEQDRRHVAAQAAILTIEGIRAMWDTTRPPQMRYNVFNRGPAIAYAIRLESLDDPRRPPEQTATIAPNGCFPIIEWTPPNPARTPDGAYVARVRLLHRDGNGQHRTEVVLWIGREPNRHGGLEARVRIVAATVDDGPHPTMHPDPAVADVTIAPDSPTA